MANVGRGTRPRKEKAPSGAKLDEARKRSWAKSPVIWLDVVTDLMFDARERLLTQRRLSKDSSDDSIDEFRRYLAFEYVTRIVGDDTEGARAIQVLVPSRAAVRAWVEGQSITGKVTYIGRARILRDAGLAASQRTTR